MSADKPLPQKLSPRKSKVGEEVKEAIKPQIKRVVDEDTISRNPDDFLIVNRDLDYIYFGSDTESETDSDSNSDVFFIV